MSIRPLKEAHRKILIRIDENLLEKLKASYPEVYERIEEKERRWEKNLLDNSNGQI